MKFQRFHKNLHEKNIKTIFTHVLKALVYLQAKQIAHLHLSTTKIFLRIKNDEVLEAKIGDFRFAKKIEPEQLVIRAFKPKN